MDDIIKAVRNDPVVGRFSCSSIDECMTDEELKKLLIDLEVTSSEEAIQILRETELDSFLAGS